MGKFIFPLPVGLESESYVYDGHTGLPVDVLAGLKDLNGSIPKGSATSDAGLNQIELINRLPHADFRQAVAELLYFESLLPTDWCVQWTSLLPGYQPGQEVKWAVKERYGVMHQALARECPDTWHLVKQMATRSALHINIGLNPWTPAGMLVLNLLNNVGPFISHQLREEFPESRGHMSVWQGWARPERLPAYGDFYKDRADFKRQFSALPRLIRGEDKENGPWYVDLETPQDPTCSSDLGSFWKLVRVKRAPDGQYYIEIRILPTVPLRRLERLVEQVLRGVLALILWCENLRHSPCATLEEAAPALKVAHRASPDFFPQEPLTRDEWEKLFVS